MPISGLIDVLEAVSTEVSTSFATSSTRHNVHQSFPMADSHMSASNQTADSSSNNFATIFEAASNNYKTLTGQDLRTHPLATELESNNNSPDSILGIFRKQAQLLDKFCNDDDKLMKSLTPIVNILFTFSTTAGANIGLVSLCGSLYAGSKTPFS